MVVGNPSGHDGMPFFDSGQQSQRRPANVGRRRYLRANPEQSSASWRGAEDSNRSRLLRDALGGECDYARHAPKTDFSYVAIVMRQYRQYLGQHALTVQQVPADIDVVASLTE